MKGKYMNIWPPSTSDCWIGQGNNAAGREPVSNCEIDHGISVVPSVISTKSARADEWNS